MPNAFAIEGYVLFFAVGLLALLVIGIWLVRKALRHRTPGWIVGGFWAAVLLIFPSSLLLLGIGALFVFSSLDDSTWNHHRGMALTPTDREAIVALRARDRARDETRTRLVSSPWFPFEFRLPNDWQSIGTRPFQLSTNQRYTMGVELYQLILNTDQWVETLINAHQADSANYSVSQPTPILLGEKRFLRYARIHNQYGEDLRTLSFCIVDSDNIAVRLWFSRPDSRDLSSDDLFHAIAETFVIGERERQPAQIAANFESGDPAHRVRLVGTAWPYEVWVPKAWQEAPAVPPIEFKRTLGVYRLRVIPGTSAGDARAMAERIVAEAARTPGRHIMARPRAVQADQRIWQRLAYIESHGTKRLFTDVFCYVRPNGQSLRIEFSAPAIDSEKTMSLAWAIVQSVRFSESAAPPSP